MTSNQENNLQTTKEQSTNDTTSYVDKLSLSVNKLLESFTGCECLMVRRIKEKDRLKNKSGNCHLNVKFYVETYGGKSVSGWILNRDSMRSDRGMYVWAFHSVWEKPDGKWVDVTDDKHYLGRDKSIFVPDAKRLPNFVEGFSYNNFVFFDEPKFAAHYGSSIGMSLLTNKIYWTDTVMLRMLDAENHDGVYRWLNAEYPRNIQKMCDEYEMEIINGKPKPKAVSKYENSQGFPAKLLFEYSLNSRG